MGLDPENWMSHLDPSVRVIDSYIPGSHDASAYLIGDRSADMRNESVGAITQAASYMAQLNAGSRFFDMRCTRHDDGYIYMKHSDYLFQRLEDVLKQLLKFHSTHLMEFLFLDFDFDSDQTLSDQIADIVETILGTANLAYSHVSPTHVGYNTDLTWGMLREKSAPFIVMWSLGGSGRWWQAKNSEIRIDLYDDFDKKTPREIVNSLDSMLGSWVKEYDPTINYGQDGKELPNLTGKLVATQLVNTPLLSPIFNPGNRDLKAKDIFNPWILAKTPGSNLGIVKMDFLNVGYKREIIEHIIRMNTFSTPPDLPPLTVPINYRDPIHLRTQDNRYISVENDTGILTLVDTVDGNYRNCTFILRDYDFIPTKPLPYSGNLPADTQSARGNFRMVHLDSNDSTTVSVNMNNAGMLYWGISWAAANNQETFAFFDPNDLNNDGQIYVGSRVMVRAMLNATDNNFLKAFDAFAEGAVRIVPGFGDGWADALRKDPSHQIFWLVGVDPDSAKNGAPRLYAASPGTLLADQFIIELAVTKIAGPVVQG